MKNLIFLLFGLIACYNSKATHLMGGQITAEHIGKDSVKVVLTLYRDTSGVPMDTSLVNINIRENTLAAMFVIIPLKSFSNIGNGVEEYIFEVILDTSNYVIADNNLNNYNIYWSNCCRNGAILNLTNPLSEFMYLNTDYSNAGTINSTPVFLSQPVTIAMQNQPFQYNPLPFDADGDSLVWYMSAPSGNIGTPCVGYTIPTSVASGPFTLDATTGQISWTPDMIGNWNATVVVDEYRNGLKIGKIVRDMQIIVLDSASIGVRNKPAITINGTTVADLQQLSFNLYETIPFTIAAQVLDIDNDALKITAQGEPFIIANTATANITDGLGLATAAVSWTPGGDEVRQAPYLMALRIFERNPALVYIQVKDITISLTVLNKPSTISNNNLNTLPMQIQPNPANNQAFVVANNSTNKEEVLQVFDVMGKVVLSNNIALKQGANLITLNTSNLANGIYLVHITGQTKRLLVQH